MEVLVVRSPRFSLDDLLANWIATEVSMVQGLPGLFVCVHVHAGVSVCFVFVHGGFVLCWLFRTDITFSVRGYGC